MHLFAFGELRVDELAVEDACTFRVRWHQPDDEADLDFIIEWQPAQEKRVTVIRMLLKCDVGWWWRHVKIVSDWPSNEKIGEGLHAREESEHNPVHHPFHLQPNNHVTWSQLNNLTVFVWRQQHSHTPWRSSFARLCRTCMRGRAFRRRVCKDRRWLYSSSWLFRTQHFNHESVNAQYSHTFTKSGLRNVNARHNSDERIS